MMQLYLLRRLDATGDTERALFAECAVFSDGATVVYWSSGGAAEADRKLDIYDSLEAALAAQTGALLVERMDYQ
jgi:hypothetical protein